VAFHAWEEDEMGPEDRPLTKRENPVGLEHYRVLQSTLDDRCHCLALSVLRELKTGL
jgi:hypothetical protein